MIERTGEESRVGGRRGQERRGEKRRGEARRGGEKGGEARKGGGFLITRRSLDGQSSLSTEHRTEVLRHSSIAQRFHDDGHSSRASHGGGPVTGTRP